MPTPHIQASKEDVAPYVLFFGDPLRSKNAAEKFLHDYKMINSIRGALGYTGYTSNNVRISIMTHGMGQPSLGIYAYELINYYDVKVIIRAGTCGAYQKDLNLGDIIFAKEVITDSNWPSLHNLDNSTVMKADNNLLSIGEKQVQKLNIPYQIGTILTSDVFYDNNKDAWKKYYQQGILGVEMETYALYQLASQFNIKALSIVSVSDSYHNHQEMTPEIRSKLHNMVTLAITILEEIAQ